MKYLSYKNGGLLSLLFVFCLAFTSCDYEFELPEANSKADDNPPTAGFSYSQTDAEDFRVVSFSNSSSSATKYSWDFGTGDTSTDRDPSYVYPGEGTWTVSLTSSDENGASATSTQEVMVIEPEEPDAIVPEVLNGDFEGGQDDWKVSTFTDGTTSPFNTSSDGANTDYDGNDTGAKTPGAKWTMGTSGGPLASGNSRYAYQAHSVSPGVTYVIEWDYSLKNETEDQPGGDRLILQMLDGHYDDGADALNATVVAEHVGLEALGKGNFTTVKFEFEAPASGKVAFWIWAVTSEDVYADNIKLYPKG